MALDAFDLVFDFTDDHKIKFENVVVTGIPLDTCTIRVEIIHPNGIEYPGSASNNDLTYNSILGRFEGGTFDVYQQSDGLPYQGLYQIRMVAYSNGQYFSGIERSYQLSYAPVEVELFADFDVFTPQLAMMDNTPSYSKAGFSHTLTKVWYIEAPAVNLTWSATNTDAVLLADSDGYYYDTKYNVHFEAVLRYTDVTYPWVHIDERLIVDEEHHAYSPPRLSELLDMITDYKRQSDSYLGVNNVLYNSTKKRYDHAWAVFHHLVDKICGGSASYSVELNTYIEEILTNLADGQMVTRTHTNLAIKPFDPEDFCAGSANANVDKNYVFNQSVAANIWTIVHNLDKFPSVTVTDHSNKVVVPDTIEYLDTNTVRLTFLQPQAGSAILN